MTDEPVLETVMEMSSHSAAKPVMTMCLDLSNTHYILFGQG